MKNKKMIVFVTAIGLLGASAGVGASSMFSKVNGTLHKDVVVSVNGEHTSMNPIYIDGKAYLPARDTAAALGFSVNWSSKSIELKGKAQQQEEEAEYIQGMGVIASIEPTDEEGRYRIELLGKGPVSWIILYADKETVLTDANGKAIAAKDLKEGMRIEAQFGPMIALSYPGQSHAAKIVVRGESLIKEGAIQSVNKTDDGWVVQFGEVKDGSEIPTLSLNSGKETSLLSSEGIAMEWEDVKAGTQVRAYYGPIMTKSIPPQSPLHYLIVLDGQEELAPASIQEFRELAWSKLSEADKAELVTKKDEAVVEIITSSNVALMMTTDAQKKLLADIQAADGKLISVTYNTQQDALLGPLTLVFDPDSKELVGQFVRM